MTVRAARRTSRGRPVLRSRTRRDSPLASASSGRGGGSGIESPADALPGRTNEAACCCASAKLRPVVRGAVAGRMLFPSDCCDPCCTAIPSSHGMADSAAPAADASSVPSVTGTATRLASWLPSALIRQQLCSAAGPAAAAAAAVAAGFSSSACIHPANPSSAPQVLPLASLQLLCCLAFPVLLLGDKTGRP